MPHTIHYPILEKIGLSHGEALIFELLLEKGRSKASDLVESSGLGRGNAYNILNSLREKGLVQVVEGKQQMYQCVDPGQLRNILDLKVQETQRLSAEFHEDLGKLQSAFQLSTGKPTIELFEGVEGIEQAIFDTLNSKTEILTYVDVHAITDEMAQINKRYLRARIKKQVQKRLIVADTQEARAFFKDQNTPFTTVAFVPNFPAFFETALEIYDGAISHLTLSKEKKIAVILRDPSLYDFHRKQFEYTWQQASEIKTYAATLNS